MSGDYQQFGELVLESTTESGPRVLDPAEWIDAYGDYLYRYAVSRLRDANAAEETVQETFLAGIRHHTQFQRKGSQRAWLLGILKRKIIDYVRARSRLDQATSDDGDSALENMLFDESGSWRDGAHKWAAEPASRLQGEELWKIVRECLAHVPANQADVFVLSVMDGMSSDEICSELSISQSNLWVRLHRARLQLANCVGSKWNHDPAA